MTRQSIAEALESAADRIADISRADLQIILRRAALMLRNVAGVPLEPATASAAPHSVKTLGGDTSVMSGVFGVAMAEIILDEAQVIATVGEREAAGVAEHICARARRVAQLRM
ncbi:hypothetical protein GCM10010869_27690 [Mesorhizobium tianshanense]|uniref:Uncharacterized protein n=1 Tax=Mesorhizobium tianshanense TaxID=39844 RepID=A0A562MBC1_9HYPH|nr:hypothetical protein [Mesorhizobium tianshanense]TWI17226.1 hypothetical protein IQ26_07577 [Mesorhizobium tianshanense]GLS37176.1 hypothetical protein GCM10010869_27690 [Mesorhizobium tianshanense]